MSHALSSVSIADASRIVTAAPPKVSPAMRGLLWLLVLAGVGAFVYGVQGPNAKATWAALQVNFTYWFMFAAASTCFAAVFQICNAQWARPIKRLFEASNNFFLLCLIPLLVMIAGHGELFAWAHEKAPGKEMWLTSGFLYTRDIIAILLLVYLGKKLIFYSLARDIGAIRGGLTGLSDEQIARWKDPRYDKYVRGWSDDTKAEIDQVCSKLGRLAPVVVIAFAFIMSLVAFDQIMSVDYHWYSTLFGAFYFISGVYLTMAMMAMGIGVSREFHPLFRAKIERKTLHDLGKLLFGFGIFWAYLFWSHYLPIWYANIPEETGWIITRLRIPPWHAVSWIVLGSCFIVPFFLGLSRDVKQVPTLLFATGAIVACGLWLQQYVLFVPTIFPDRIPLSFIDVVIALGFLGAYLLSAAAYLEKVPLMPFGDLYARTESGAPVGEIRRAA